MNRDAAERPRWRLLLAGSVGPERAPARPDTPSPRWFEPPHVRDEGGALDRLASQVAAGADIIVAPTWLTHRRALLPVGETRQARAWTAAAVRVAREAVELGMERRAEARAGSATDDDREEAQDLPSRPAPLVAASLPSLDEEPESEAGRLLPRAAATERDYRDQAGLLADARPDLLLVEGQATLAEVRTAANEAAATGLLTWLALSGLGGLGAGGGPAREESALDLAREAGIARSLLPPPPRHPAAVGDHAWGGLVGRTDLDVGSDREDPATAWLVAGAGALGLLDGATPDRVGRIRKAVDEHERAEVAGWRDAERRWWAHVRLAADMAPGGAALWLAPEADDESAGSIMELAGGAAGATLPHGFAWVVVGREGSGGLPRDHFRLVIDPVGGGGAATRWGGLLERGGILALPFDPAARTGGITTLLVDDSQPPPLAILRRDA